MKVRVLADDVINKIAAGEVVDRPASVVRELVDNALDAGATDIHVTLEEGGQRLIRVVDNGCGMERDDALLALERHATSKLSSADDLLSIATLGFRGEALPSIAAVSRLDLRTRPSEQNHGTEILIEGGVIKSVHEGACPPGTQIEVRQLFYNTPARRKFLKSPRTEEMRIRAWLVSASLSRPEVRFRLVSDGKDLLSLPRAESVSARAKLLFRGATQDCALQRGGIEVAGLVMHPGQAQHDAGAFVILVNGRVVSDKLILRALREGFDSTLKDREFPLGFLSLRVDPADVDVNVHPQKSEVRFRGPQAVFDAVRTAVQNAVRNFVVPVSADDFDRPLAGSSAIPSLAFQPQSMPFSAAPTRSAAFQGEIPSIPLQVARGPSPAIRQEPFRFSELRYIGQILECYLVCEWQSSLYVVDMHAAHERINYNRIRMALSQRGAAAQQLLVPVPVRLTLQGLSRCMEYQHLFADLGFEWDALGEDTLVVRAIPGFLSEARLVPMIKELAAITEDMDPRTALSGQLDSIAARLACHASVRSGKPMEREEVYALFNDLDDAQFSAACPHGRPISVSFSATAIESWFGRDR